MTDAALLAFNRGRISKLALARTDFKRTALSAEVQTNWMPRTLGSMMLRPGLGYTGNTRNNLASKTLPFIFARDDTARLEMTDGTMRVWANDSLVTRSAVTTAITNGNFDSDLSGWTDQDAGTAVSVWAAGGFLALSGTVNAAAKRRQQVSCSGANIGVRHALDIAIERGPVLIRVGSAAGDDSYITETTLQTGSHSLAFTPTGDFWIDLFGFNEPVALVSSIVVASSGVMEVATPWPADKLSSLRWDQSGDVVFVACKGIRQRRIERRAVDSWSVVTYQSDDGPFRIQNVGPITITPSDVSGDVTLTASAALFRATQVGTLFRLQQQGQSADVELTGANQFSDPIRVVGVDGTRVFAVIIDGIFAATITLQYSVGVVGDWVDAPAGSYTAPSALSYDDTLDNQIIYYRIGVKGGDYTSGTANATLSYSSGTQTGIARVTGYTSPTAVSAAVLRPFGGATATSDWWESYWSDYRGFPSAVALHEGRMWWAGRDRVWGSVSDAFATFDDETVGDSGPISRSIGSGPVDNINWLFSAQRLLLGADGDIWSARSSSFDEPLTPTNFNLKSISNQGAANVDAVRIDTSGVFVQRSDMRVYQASYDSGVYDYAATELTSHVPEMGEPGIVRVAAQRQPETRAHFIRNDGTVACMILDRQEEINCWVDNETPEASGFVEDVCVLPGSGEDQVYYTVRRVINGATVRFHEKWAKEIECVGGTLNKQADAFVSAGGSGATIGNLGHLEGETVVCWADGVDKGSYTVSGGSIPVAYIAGYVVGLPYTARYKSTKLAYGTEQSGVSALCQKKRISQLGIIASNLHALGLRYGPDFDTLDDMPASEKYAAVDADTIWADYDEEMFSFPGEWDTDSRLCLEASAPRPATVLACVIGLETHPK